MVAADALAPNTRTKPSASTALTLFNSFILSGSHSITRIDWKEMIEISRKVEEPNGLFWKYRVALTKNCNTPLRKTTDHGYHSNPCVVPHPVTLAQVCDTVSMRASDFHKGGSWYEPIPGCRLPAR